MTAWHVDDVALSRWVDGTDGSVQGASVEQHLLACADCRGRVPTQPAADPVWARVQDTIEVPKVSLLERILRRTGLSEADSRIVAISPAFRAAWLVGMAVLLAFVTVAGNYSSGRGQWLFLLVAPLVPALAVALGYDPELDEAVETECATPYSRMRLVLLRSAALLLVGGPAFVLASASLPGHLAYWWLAPAACCTALVLVLSTRVPPLTAVGAVSVGWLLIVSSRVRAGTPADLLDEGWVALYLLVAAAAFGMLLLQRGRLLTWGVR